MSSQRSLSVVVGEDQPLFRAGVVHVLRGAGLDVIDEAGDAADVVRKVTAHAPDVAILDIHMPPNYGDDGLLAARQIRTVNPTVAVLVLSKFLEDRYALDLLADRTHGAGYLLKDRISDVDSFVGAVRRVARGGSAIDPEVVARLIGRRRRHGAIDDLSPREREVLTLVAQGRSNQGIADSLVVTTAAVERHVTNIFTKLGIPRDPTVHRRVLAVLRYLQC